MTTMTERGSRQKSDEVRIQRDPSITMAYRTAFHEKVTTFKGEREDVGLSHH